jgi:hypothetical protein
MAADEVLMHAPGPWSVDGEDIRDDLGELVAFIYIRDTDDSEEANTYLVAAAPDLLAVCQKIAANAQPFMSAWEFEQFCGVDGEKLFVELKAAIAATVAPTESPTCTEMFPEGEKT